MGNEAKFHTVLGYQNFGVPSNRVKIKYFLSLKFSTSNTFSVNE